MPSHNPDPHLLDLLMRLINESCGFKYRLHTLESQNEEILQKLDRLENSIPNFRHLVDENEKLQNLVDFYCPPD